RRRTLQGFADSKQVEILPVLPFGHIGVLRLARGLLAATRDLGFLDVCVVAHEAFAEAGAEAAIGTQRRQRLLERCRQRLGRTLVGRVRGRTGVELARDAIETGVSL